MMRRKHEGEAGGVEHAGLGIDGLAKVLGEDEGMVAASFGNDAVDMEAVGRNQAADILGSVKKDALEAILLLSLEGDAPLALEQGAGGPGGTPKNTGGVGGSGHGVEVLVELKRVDLLGLVDGEEKISGGANDPGRRVTGEELEAGFAQQEHIALG